MMKHYQFVTDHVGTITRWQTDYGDNILYPMQEEMTPEGRSGGGLFLASPVFDEVPGTLAWVGVAPPRYGLVRTIQPNHPVTSIHDPDGKLRTFELSLDSRESYPWSHSVQTTVNCESDLEVDYGVVIYRSKECVNPRYMPLSFGLHPYFATHGTSWRILTADRLLIDSSQTVSQPLVFQLNRGEEVFLHTGRGIMRIKTAGFDRYRIWSDKPKEYVCIEPTKGVEKDLLLRPGEAKHGWCTMKFFEAPRQAVRW